MSIARVTVLITALSVTGAAPAPPPFVVTYLRALGFVSSDRPGGVAGGSSLVTPSVLRLAQEELGLSPTGVLDAVTLDMFSQQRCGVSPTWLAAPSPPGRTRRFALMGSRWRPAVLTYKVSVYSLTVPKATVDRTLSTVLDHFSSSTKLKFAAAVPGDTEWNLDIRFTGDDHGCSSVFDATVLAHAFPPEFGGDLHVRDAVDFNTTSLTYVLGHELAHSLGVHHSNRADALMYPVYRDVDPLSPLLSGDDLRALQLLYGQA
ncbi:hypothetical protein ONE63_000747 [Megalurothrips usitatus]|uniref:Peptidase metallopeptidase domain-containing protein n=1 Tax=Megalurothrips usitatus TaxID=439358 RepID=A0AAV7XGU8_9NEOP|nr:hypothetical protein ONE63_002133 [Megalurothrips usitatus]KAJ1524670.1 hypothetical protein ONE63_011153 [Megalurothrips usitatus]KAJ1531649.1 hypothetical protein ONE63_000320 [Megalurothrips usitatus]KAJ1532121.1 hypothetical protein ONE63_000747 [Megalurothrips usitatus]